MTHIFNPKSAKSWGDWVNLMPPGYGTNAIPSTAVPVNDGITPDTFEEREAKKLGSQLINQKNAEIETLRDYIDYLESGD